MTARTYGPPDRENDQNVAALFRNLLLFGLLLYLFTSEAGSLFTHESESDLVADASSDAGNLYNQLVLSAAFFATCILVYAHRVPVRVVWATMMPMAPMLLLIALSTMWSDYPELTVRRASHEIIEVTTLALLASCFSSATVVLRIFFLAFLTIGILDIFSAVAFPDSLTVLGFAGIHGHKNLAGQFFFLALPVFLLGSCYREISRNRLLGIFCLIFGAAMLVLTDSKTSLGATIVAFSLVALTRGLSNRDPGLRVPLLLLCLLALLCAIAAIMNWTTDELLEMLVGDPTLTGRDGIWLYAISKFDGSPMLGVGYGAIWQVGPAIQGALQDMGIMLVFNEAHNGYLEIASQLGIVGLICLAIFLIATLLNTLSCWATIERHAFYGVGALSVYVFWGFILFNVTESLYFQAGLASVSTFMFLAAFVASYKKRSMIETTAKATRSTFAPIPYA